jgi:hypothetical protein
MQQIDLEPTEFRRGRAHRHPLTNPVFMRAAVLSAVYFVLVVAYGRLFSPPVAWYLVAIIAFAPGLMLAYIAISLDD